MSQSCIEQAYYTPNESSTSLVEVEQLFVVWDQDSSNPYGGANIWL